MAMLRRGEVRAAGHGGSGGWAVWRVASPPPPRQATVAPEGRPKAAACLPAAPVRAGCCRWPSAGAGPLQGHEHAWYEEGHHQWRLQPEAEQRAVPLQALQTATSSADARDSSGWQRCTRTRGDVKVLVGGALLGSHCNRRQGVQGRQKSGDKVAHRRSSVLPLQKVGLHYWQVNCSCGDA